MIRDVVLHLHGRPPLLADLRAVPGPGEVMLLAHNVRTRDGKRPSFAEETDSWFLIALHEISIIELPKGAEDGQALAAPAFERRPEVGPPGSADTTTEPPDTTPLDTDEDLLARIRGI